MFQPANNRRSVVLVAFALVALSLALYGRTAGYGFVDFDDNEYISYNDHVRTGLSRDNVRWAFSTFHLANWTPLTLISYQLDVSVFGVNPGRLHLVNAALHAASAAVLFLGLLSMTGALWRSAFAAALFAVHPLHVESVAWIAERKDVLSGFFFLLMLPAYAEYVRHPNGWRYGRVVLFFLLGLMAKPMLVTAPFVLVLLDVWPLGRIKIHAGSAFPRLTGVLPSIREKLPLFLLACASAVVTYIAQQEGGAMLLMQSGRLGFAERLANASVSYAAYLGKTLLPVSLSVFYPFSVERISLPAVAASLLLIMLITVLVLGQLGKRPYLAAGWFWFLGMLVPVIGLVQVGSQAMADRYTYLPLTGLFLIVSWGLGELYVTAAGSVRTTLLAVATAVLVVFSATTFVQTGKWADSETLFGHALSVTENNWMAYNSLGIAAYNKGHGEEARERYEAGLRINPGFADGHYNLGLTLFALGRVDDAIIQYQTAIALYPQNARYHNNLGIARAKRGQREAALEQFKEALRLQPDYPIAANNLRILESSR